MTKIEFGGESRQKFLSFVRPEVVTYESRIGG